MHKKGLRFSYSPKKSTLSLVAGISAFFFTGCSLFSESSVTPSVIHPMAGMRSIHATGKSFRQGSQDPLATADESPVLENSFTYDFSLDTTEVTQSAFSALMGRNPVPAQSAYGAGGEYPVYNVSWFDAVLYCNARSKAAGLDTVYVYSGRQETQAGQVYGLDGLSIHLQAAGFRLPTEAEWEFSAQGGAATGGIFPWGNLQDTLAARDYAWYNGNAGNASHPVAKLKPNALGLYDMAGNVMEWVNDWKGAYPKSGGADFAGARDPGPTFDIPIKGGAFKYGVKELRPANRVATYAAIRSAQAEYVGFRCALGAIAHPHYSSSDGAWVATDPVTLDIGRIQKLVGGRSAKLVFVNANAAQRHLVYVDYSQYPPRVQEFGDANNVFYPVISPDGRYVAYSTQPEGAVQGSSIYIRSLDSLKLPAQRLGAGFIPRWHVDSVQHVTNLIYTQSAMDNASPAWSTTQTWSQKINGGLADGAAVQLTSDGGFHDGLSRDGRFLATGFRLLKLRDMRSGTTRTLFTAPLNGKNPGDTSQVCNVSMAPDASGRMLFLDFGYPDSSRLVGRAYDIHELAFIADTVGLVTRWYAVPPGERGWEDLEWTNEAGYAVSGAGDAQGARRHLYLLNLKDSSYARLATGTELEDPGLWLGVAPDSLPSAGLDLDSLGHYNEPVNNGSQLEFANKMRLFWKLHKDVELLAVGSSHAEHGINPNLFSHYLAFNMAFSAGSWNQERIQIVDYILNLCPKIKVLIMEVHLGTMVISSSNLNFDPMLSLTKGFSYDQSNGFWADSPPPNLENLMNQAPNPILSYVDSLGFTPRDPVNWGAQPIPQYLTDTWTVADPDYQRTMGQVEDVTKLVSGRHIQLVIVNFPQNPAYKNTPHYQMYGPGWKTAGDIIQKLKSLESLSPYVHFYDAYNFGNHDYIDEDANDYDHLSYKGARKLTLRLDSLINTLSP